MKYINAEGQVLGRVCSYVAKQALLGEDVVIVNAEKALISGEKSSIQANEKAKLEIKNLGNYTEGPFHHKRPDRYVRRAVRGMLPYKKQRGRDAYKRVSVYIGVPSEEIKKNHGVEASKIRYDAVEGVKKHLRRSVTVGELCGFIGGKW
ncbi:MAG: 50S ribosomal protein L13 [Candidatus Altiarchaeota archaeon]